MTSRSTCALPGCGAVLARDGRRRLFCSEAHRARAARLRARGVDLAAPQENRPTDGPIYAAAHALLAAAGATDTILGRAALNLAAALDDPASSPSGVVAASAELPRTIAAAIESATPSTLRLIPGSNP